MEVAIHTSGEECDFATSWQVRPTWTRRASCSGKAVPCWTCSGARVRRPCHTTANCGVDFVCSDCRLLCRAAYFPPAWFGFDASPWESLWHSIFQLWWTSTPLPNQLSGYFFNPLPCFTTKTFQCLYIQLEDGQEYRMSSRPQFKNFRRNQIGKKVVGKKKGGREQMVVRMWKKRRGIIYICTYVDVERK